MALKLYRRHRKECEARHQEDTRSGEFEESRRGWKKCNCLIHASGSLRGKFKRKNTGRSDWHEAKILAAELEKAASWDGEIAILAAPELSASPKRMPIERAVKTFLDELREHAATATHKKYRLLLKKFRSFSERRGYVMDRPMGARRYPRIPILMACES
jgi:hypothetical protein